MERWDGNERRAHTRYGVKDSSVSYRKAGETIRLRMVIVRGAQSGTSGGEGRVPEVSHHEVLSIQEAVLEKSP